ncbi:MAG: AraC family transcriptional regulator [Planctomycetota bacterium]|jgi:AraC-like DNA-binding protein|nr:AraC family transcriptional regulator [Planctomycetota bacterium]
MLNPKLCYPKTASLKEKGLLPAIVGIGSGSFQPRTPQMQGRVKTGALKIGYVHRGRATWEAAEQQFILATGQAFMVNAGEMATGIDRVIDGVECCWIMVNERKLTDSKAVRALERQRAAVCPVAPLFGQALQELYRIEFDANNTERAQGDALLAYVIAELVRGIRKGDEAWSPGETVNTGNATVDRAAKMLSRNLAYVPLIEDVAAKLEVTRVHLHRLFRQELGLSPMGYIQQLRLDKARDLLAAGTAVKDTHLQVSLNTPGELSRLFRQALGLAPSEWAQLHGAAWREKRT